MAWIKTNLKQYKNEQKRIDEYMDYKVKKGMEAHKTSAVLDHPDGSVTDEKIGNRTMVNPLSPSEEVTGPLTWLLSVISNAVQTLRANLSQTHSTLDTKIAQGDRDTQSACSTAIKDAVDELENKITQGDERTLANANEYTRSYSYSKSAADTALNAKADKSTTLSGYGIGDAYTKGEVDAAITSPKDKFEFSNGIQLKVEGEEVFIFKDGIEPTLFAEISNGRTWVYADEATDALTAKKANFARNADADMYGKIIHEHYATKEEVGNIETALDSIIAIQNSLIGGGSV